MSVEVTVLTTSLNYGKYIKQCIDSVLEQKKWCKIEVNRVNHIIMDGGSTDDTADVVKEHLGQNVYLYVNEGDGQTTALNLGMKVIEEDFPSTTHVGWLNADDYYKSYWLDLSLQTLMKEPPDVALVTSVAEMIGGTTGYTLRRLVKYPDASSFIMFGNIIVQPTVFIRFEAFKRLRDLTGFYFNPEYNYTQDFELWHRFLKNGFRLRILDKVTTVLRTHPDQMSRRNLEKQTVDRDRIIMEICRAEGFATPLWVTYV